MKIIYLTNAQNADDFKEYLRRWKVSPNLSNQNFHNKLIRALSTKHDVLVISVRSLNKNFDVDKLPREEKKESNISWQYIEASSSLIKKVLYTHKNIMKELKDKVSKDDVIIVDTLSRTLLLEALRIKNKFGIRAFGVCTDNPYNISYVKKSYGDKQIKRAQKLDGYISLTEKIDELFNKERKKSILIDGITEQNKPDVFDKRIENDYLFFGGSLMRKYGVYNLIDAFNNLNYKDLKLVLCGHHEESDLKEIVEKNKNIIYLGAQNYDQVRNLESHALVCINPRPKMDEIDLYSIPSKTLEYLASGSLTITTTNILLKERYNDAIIWADSGESKDLVSAILKALNMSKEERNKKISLSLKLIDKYTSFDVIANKVEELF